jgi:hypothetical protein
LSIWVTAYAQEQHNADSSRNWRDMQFDKLFEMVMQNEENSTVPEETALLEENPIDLNTTSAEDLCHIPIITNLMASRIIAKRTNVQFVSKEDLLRVEGLTPELLPYISPFVTIDKLKDGSGVKGSFISRTYTEVEKRKGFLNGAFRGSQMKVLNRFHASIGSRDVPVPSVISSIEIGGLTKKDPGEQSLTSFSSGFLSITMPTLKTHLITGDYQLEAAEGLIFWSASAFSKGNDVIATVRKNGGGLRPYRSSDENSYFRGFATSTMFKKIHIQILYSNKAINATVDSLGLISSMDRTGLFRTENELLRQNSSREILIGGRMVLYPVEGIKLGGTGYRARFENPLVLKKMEDVNVNELWMYGIDVSYTGRKMYVFAEFAIDRAKAIAMISGITYEPSPTLSMTLAARKYPSTFESIHGNAFGESGLINNEYGVYAGVRLKPIRWLRISTYYDQYNHYQSTASISVPSHGNDLLVFSEFQIAKRFEVSLRLKRKESLSLLENFDLYGRTIKLIIPRLQESYRFTSEFVSSPSVRLSNRLELIKINYNGMKKAEQGFLMYQSMKWNLSQFLFLHARLAIFDTDSYDSRIYEFEEDLLGTYSNPALYGRGLRWYFILRHQISSKMYVSAKVAQTFKEGVKYIGTGLDEILGNSQSNVGIQIEVRF